MFEGFSLDLEPNEDGLYVATRPGAKRLTATKEEIENEGLEEILIRLSSELIKKML